jgi:hypothetical protein
MDNPLVAQLFPWAAGQDPRVARVKALRRPAPPDIEPEPVEEDVPLMERARQAALAELENLKNPKTVLGQKPLGSQTLLQGFKGVF